MNLGEAARQTQVGRAASEFGRLLFRLGVAAIGSHRYG